MAFPGDPARPNWGSHVSGAQGVVLAGSGADDVVDITIPGKGPFTVRDNGGFRLNGASGGRVNVLFWGQLWKSMPPYPSVQDLLGDFSTILSGPYQHAVTQYNHGALSCGGLKLGFSDVLMNDFPIDNFTINHVWFRLSAYLSFNPGLVSPFDVYMVIMPPGVRNVDRNVAGSHGRSWQWGQTIVYGWVQFDTRDEMTRIFSHEVIEAISDPNGDAIQLDPTDIINWNEIGDVCGGLAGRLDGVWVQAYWSAKDGSCVIPTEATLPFFASQLKGLWNVVANSYPGTLNVQSMDGLGNISGVIFGDPIVGFWNEESRIVTFLRIINSADPSTFQVYTACLFQNLTPLGNQPTNTYSLAGTFEAFAGTGAVAQRADYGWIGRQPVI